MCGRTENSTQTSQVSVLTTQFYYPVQSSYRFSGYDLLSHWCKSEIPQLKATEAQQRNKQESAAFDIAESGHKKSKMWYLAMLA